MLRALFVATALCAVAALSAAAHDSHAEPVDAEPMPDRVLDAEEARARDYFTDTVLTTSSGEDVRFYSDLLSGRTVVISFFFADCQDACPLINHALRAVQAEIGERVGEDIFVVSLTVDPENDTPERLAEYHTQYDAGPGWRFVTGSREAIDAVSGRLGQVFEREAHLTTLLVGNTKTARWRKLEPNLAPEILATQIIEIADDTAE